MSHLLASTLGLPPVEYEGARGSWVHARDGSKYLDGSSGAVCANIGHNHPHVIRAMQRQLERSVYALPAGFRAEETELLADRICQLTGWTNYDVMLSSTGTTAVELGIALARQHYREIGEPTRTRIVSSWMSYHGSSAAALALSGHRRRRPPLSLCPTEVPSIEPPYPGYHARHHPGHACTAECAEEVAVHIERLGAREVAAVIVEPMSGVTGGARLPPAGYLDRVRQICDEAGCLLIYDEVMVGLGRAGAAFASQRLGSLLPDICVIAKGLGAGHATISAVLAAKKVSEAIQGGSGVLPLSGTMAGNPLSAATALAVLEVLEKLGVFDGTSPAGRGFRERGDLLGERLRRSLAGAQGVLEVRGMGYLWAVELARGTLGPVMQELRRRRLALYPFNGYMPDGSGEGLLVAPPLTASDGELAYLEENLQGAIGDARAAGRSGTTRFHTKAAGGGQ